MLKIFFDKRHISISSDYEECSKLRNSVVYIIHALDSIPYILDEFIENNRLTDLCLCTENISEDATFKEICNNFTKVIAAGGLVLNLKNEVLMIYRFNHWDLPKGWHESDETIEKTAIREVEEECGLHGLELVAPITKTYHIYKQNDVWILKETHWFKLRYKKDEQPKPQIEEGIEDVKWISMNNLSEYLDKTYPSIKEVFKASKIL